MNPELVVLLVRILLALLLYLFLGAILVTLWQDLRQAVRAGAARPRQYGRIVVADPGPVSGLEKGAVFPLHPVNSFGRAATNTVPVPDETASSNHARLSLQGDHWLLEDSGSRNGTRLNGVLIETPTVVTPEDVFQIGRVAFRLVFD